MAQLLRKGFSDKGYEFYIPTTTNQIFVVLNNEKLEELKKVVKFSFWERLDNERTVVRFATCWATKIEDINALVEVL